MKLLSYRVIEENVPKFSQYLTRKGGNFEALQFETLKLRDIMPVVFRFNYETHNFTASEISEI